MDVSRLGTIFCVWDRFLTCFSEATICPAPWGMAKVTHGYRSEPRADCRNFEMRKKPANSLQTLGAGRPIRRPSLENPGRCCRNGRGDSQFGKLGASARYPRRLRLRFQSANWAMAMTWTLPKVECPASGAPSGPGCRWRRGRDRGPSGSCPHPSPEPGPSPGQPGCRRCCSSER